MPAVRSVLVVGAGAAGTATAILLAERGVSVDLVDVKPDVGALGSGITLQGNALRVFRQLGVWPKVQQQGYAFDSLGIRAPDPNGTLVAEIPDARTGGPDLPATVGMYRPDLARILVDRAAEVGAKVRFGTTYTSLSQDDDGVDVTFADGSSARYDLVVGADGVRSHTREQLGIELETKQHRHGDLAGVRAAAGQRHPHRPGVRRPLLHRRLLPDRRGHPLRLPGRGRPGPQRPDARGVARGDEELAGAYHGPWDEIRESLVDPRARELHLVRGARARRALAPRPGRADRRRRAHLSAHPGPGRRAGPRGRRRAQRAAARPRGGRPTTCGPSSPSAASAARARSSRRRCSWANGSSTASRATCPRSWVGWPSS